MAEGVCERILSAAKRLDAAAKITSVSRRSTPRVRSEKRLSACL